MFHRTRIVDDSEVIPPDRWATIFPRSSQIANTFPATASGRFTEAVSKLTNWSSGSCRCPCARRRSVLVFWERTQTAAPEQSDAQADVVVTACRSLLESGVQFTVCWNDAQEQQCVSQPVRSVDELTGLLPRLLSAGTAQGESGAALFSRSSGEAVLSHIFRTLRAVSRRMRLSSGASAA